MRERVVACAGLTGVETTPAESSRGGATVVLLSSGSEPHVGPGRAWVELARRLAVAGHAVLRVDFRGWGESPDDGFAPGRPYDRHCEDDVVAIVRALRGERREPVVLVGLCAGAWIALRAVLQEPADAVIALNPQLYWQPGDPVEALLTDTRNRRTAEIARIAEGRRSGLWDAEDERGERNAAGRWLDALRAGPTRLHFLFAEGDDGLEYLTDRLERRLADTVGGGHLVVQEIPEIDHAMHRLWLRPQVFDAVVSVADRTADVRVS